MVQHMKWWGWGEEGIAFDHTDKPALGPFVHERIGLDLDAPPAGVPLVADLPIPPPMATPELRAALGRAVGAEHVHDDALDRVTHTYGKSLRDLVRIRRGELGRLPDLVVYPGDESQVDDVVRSALAADAVIIPFGGGTNISGSLEAPRHETRTVVSVDLGRMDRLLELDEEAGLARVEAGALGPRIEAQLGERGWTLGHFPDSFTHSSLGGWIATRSSGMQSDRYGDIADITRAVRVVTPTGTLATRPVPATSTGPSVREMVLGSEGRLGVITEATVVVHRLPAERRILAYMFPDWDAGLAALREVAVGDAAPSVTRLSDANETAFSMATRRAGSFFSALASWLLRAYLRRIKGYDPDRLCLAFVGYEGSAPHVRAQRRLVERSTKAHGGVGLGAGPGTLYDQKKFDTPYIRDFLLDRGGLADVSETAAPWSRLRGVYDGVVEAAEKAFATIGVRGWVMCHLSHSYRTGACLCVTFAFRRAGGHDPVHQYDVVKTAIQQAFIDHGGTLSHHHAVGREQARWLADDISPTGLTLLRTLFDGLDPGHNLNPGQITGDP
ncbi:MAG TPA: FAD-binding oxidoreductase [Acidimicrobiales bacterium]|nr:FAD-binding oxidoreductase [Acidimicrobiales bacterium]